MKDIFAEQMKNLERYNESKEEFGTIEVLVGKHKNTWVANNGGDEISKEYFTPETERLAITTDWILDNVIVDSGKETLHYHTFGVDEGGSEFLIKWKEHTNFDDWEIDVKISAEKKE